MKTKLFMISIGLTALALAGCESTTNTNINTKANNTAVVVSATPTPAAIARRDNANISKEEYEKNRAEYEKDKGNSKIGSGAYDGWIWFKTKTALATTSDLRDSTINVDVDNAVVTLSGTVASAAQKTKAEQVAKTIEGVKSVKNQLKVVSDNANANKAKANSNK